MPTAMIIVIVLLALGVGVVVAFATRRPVERDDDIDAARPPRLDPQTLVSPGSAPASATGSAPSLGWADRQQVDSAPYRDEDPALYCEQDAGGVTRPVGISYLEMDAAEPLARPTEPTITDGDLLMSLDTTIQQLLAVDGATGAAVIDSESGMALAQGGSPGFDLAVAAAGNSNVVRAKMATMREIGLSGRIDDILITLDSQYHLIKVLDGPTTAGLFIYLVLDRTRGNLALARHRLKAIADGVSI